MMKIIILTSGSRGDVQPYIALAKGIQNKGYNVKLVANSNFKDFVEDNNIKFCPVNLDIKELVESEEGIKLIESRNVVNFLLKFLDLFKKSLVQFFDEILEYCNDSDLIIHSPTAFVASYIAVKMNIPSIGAYLQPFSKTKEFPNFAFPQNISYLPFYNELSHYLFDFLSWQMIRPSVNYITNQRLKIGKLPFFFISSKFQEKNNFPIIYGYSSHIIPKPKDWRESLNITGYWFLENNNYIPPKELENFLNTDKKIIYIGFGSMSNRNSEEVAKIIENTINKLNIKAVVLSGWKGINKIENENIYMTDYIDHNWLFPKISACVHHSGAGTTSACLKSATPQIPIPFFADQPFWANRVYSLGLASKPIKRKNLNEENLFFSVKSILEDKEISKRAKEISKKISQENGIENALKSIDNILYRKTML